MAIEINIDKLIKELDLIQKLHFPKGVSQAMRSFGFDVRELHKHWLLRTRSITRSIVVALMLAAVKGS